MYPTVRPHPTACDGIDVAPILIDQLDVFTHHSKTSAEDVKLLCDNVKQTLFSNVITVFCETTV